MPRTARNFAIVEVAWFFGDPRIGELTGAERWAYLAYWVTAVEQRSEVLRPQLTPKWMASRAHVDPRSVRSALQKCAQNGLLAIAADGAVTVVGVRDKHPQLGWKVNGEQGTFVPPTSPSDITQPNQPIIPNKDGGNGEGVSDEQRAEYNRRVAVVLDSWKRLCEAHGKKRIAGEMDASVLLQAWPEFSPVRFEKVITHHWSPKGGMKVRSDCLTLKSIASNWPEIEARYEEDAEIKAEADKGTRL